MRACRFILEKDNLTLENILKDSKNKKNTLAKIYSFLIVEGEG
jgi:hypothetical protein